jgi:Transcriptional regulators
MDSLDYRLIAELRTNARASVPTLAKLLGVSRGTVKTRLDRLVADGVIAGFTIRLRDDSAHGRVRGIMLIELEGKRVRATVASLRANIGLSTLHTTNGQWDLIAEIDVASLTEFNRVVTEIRAMDGVAKSESHLMLGPA